MKVSYSDDARLGPGHGILTFDDAAFPAGNYSMAILRASDQASRADGGSGGAIWVGETRFLPVRTETTATGGLTIQVGPEVVNALDPLEQYLVTLKPEMGDPLKARLQVQGITYSLDAALDNTGARLSAKESAAARPDHAPEAAPAMAAPERAAPENVPPENAKKEAADLSRLSMAGATPEKKRRLSPVLVALLALALVAGLIGTFKFFSAEADAEKAALSGESAKTQPSQGPSGASLNPPATQKSAEEKVRAFFSGPDVTAAAALSLAASLPKSSPAEKDALYRLYYFAAENEAPGAFMPYAACLDPAKPKWGSIGKDAVAAYAAYAKAAASDAKVAKAAMDAQARLRAWLESEAGQGNAQARTWLQELP